MTADGRPPLLNAKGTRKNAKGTRKGAKERERVPSIFCPLWQRLTAIKVGAWHRIESCAPFSSFAVGVCAHQQLDEKIADRH